MIVFQELIFIGKSNQKKKCEHIDQESIWSKYCAFYVSNETTDNLDGSHDCGNKRQYESVWWAAILLHSNELFYLGTVAGGEQSVRETVPRHGRDGA